MKRITYLLSQLEEECNRQRLYNAQRLFCALRSFHKAGKLDDLADAYMSDIKPESVPGLCCSM